MALFAKKETYELPGDQVRAALSSLDILSGLLKRWPDTPHDKSRSGYYDRTARGTKAQSGSIFEVDPEIVYKIRLGARDREAVQEAAASMLSVEGAVSKTDEEARAVSHSGVLTLPTPPGEPQRTISMTEFSIGIEADIREQMEATRRLSATLEAAEQPAPQ